MSFLLDDVGRQREYLEWALKLDPNYADAWAWLAFMHMEEHFQGYNPRVGSSPVDRIVSRAR